MKKLLVAAMGIAAAYGAFADPYINAVRFTGSGDKTAAELNELAQTSAGAQSGKYIAAPNDAGNTNQYSIAALTGTLPTARPLDGEGEAFNDEPETELSVKTQFGKPLEFYVDPANDGAAKAIGDGGLYFDSLVKFTVCDDDPAQEYSDAKIVMWLQEATNSVGDVVKTNIMVKAGYLSKSGSVAATPKVYACGNGIPGDFDQKWHRVTIKAIKDITASNAGVPGFAIYIDGGNSDDIKEVANTEAKWDNTFDYALTEAAAYLNAKGTLFPSLKQGDAGNKQSLVSVGFDGTGWLNDLEVTDVAPAFAVDHEANKATVEIGGESKQFESIAEAVAEINKPGYAGQTATMSLMKSLVLDEPIVFDGNGASTITLDFAGFVLTNELADAIITNSARSLVITNSTGKGGINCTSTGAAIYQTAATFDEGAVYSALSITGGNFWGGEAMPIEFEDGYAGSQQIISGGCFEIALADYLVDGKAFADDPNEDELYEVVDKKPEPVVVTWADLLGEESEGAYLIDNLVELKAFQANVGELETAGMTFKLTTDIALDAAWPGIGIQNGKDIVNAGTPEKAEEFVNGAFRGTFDGQNHTISGFQIIGKGDNSEGLDYCGFFNSIEGATIQNLKIAYAGSLFAEDTTASTKECGATFVGVATNSVLRNLTTVAGTVSCSKGFGGIVGYLISTTVDSCTNNLNMTSLANNKCGGIAMICQRSGCTISNCENNGTMTTTSQEHGGIVGYTDTITISNCKNTAACKMFYHHGGTVTLTGDIKGNATVPSYTGAATPGLNFATVDGNVATFVADNALAAGNTYKVMATGATATYAFVEAGTIAFDTNLTQNVTFNITAAEGLELSDSTSGKVTTYTAVNQYTITFVNEIGDDPASTNFTAGSGTITLPTATTANEGVEFGGWTNETYTTAIKTFTPGENPVSFTLYAQWNTIGPQTPTIDPATSTTVEVTASTKQDAIDAVAVAAPAAAGIETAEEKAAYKALFDIDATNKGGDTWDVEIKDIKEQVKIDVAETAEAIVSGTAATGTVTVPKGLYYKVTTYETLGGTPTVAIEPVLSTGAASSEITKPGTTQGFIKVEMATTAAELAD